MKHSVSYPLTLSQFQASEGFWKDKMELVRKEVIPYQWDMLNDRVEGAAPSYCMRNYKTAGKYIRENKVEDSFSNNLEGMYRGFQVLPKDPENLEDTFYGFVFQDSDFSKWIEAVAYSLSNHPDAELEKIADEAIDVVCAAQLENGYLDTYFIINGMSGHFQNLTDLHELYCFGHLAEGAVAYYHATGKDKLLKAAMRYADYIGQCFGPEEGKRKGYPGHEEAEMALVRMYEATGDEKYLNLSRFFVDERGKKPYYWDSEPSCHGFRFWAKRDENDEGYQYHQAHRPVREQDEAVGHAVRAMYLYSGMADVARLTDDETLREACRKLWRSTVREKMYITGAIGSTHVGEAFSFPFDLPNDTAYAETCASVGLIFFARRMLQMEADSEYADIMEKALYNTVLGGMALDGKSFFYVNPLEVLPQASRKDARKAHVLPVRPKWFGCACCPPNIARLISSLPMYAYTENEDTLFMHLHMAGKVSKQVGDKTALFQVNSNMPWHGKVDICYCGRESTDMTLAVRIPGWCEKWQAEGIEKFDQRIEKGYCYLTGTWTEGTNISFCFEMVPRFYQADERVREDIGKVALMKGPVVYCAEEADNGKNLHLLQVIPEGEIREEWSDILGITLPVLSIQGERKTPASTLNTLYTPYEKNTYEATEVKMIPYFAWANRGENEMTVWLRQK
ncbi:MAG: glycoside hydrolase family 127 protein [Clostridiales bacterium]|nr:glycoside hydrolase family 127 protein [Clostridiales bacterium]